MIFFPKLTSVYICYPFQNKRNFAVIFNNPINGEFEVGKWAYGVPASNTYYKLCINL